MNLILDILIENFKIILLFALLFNVLNVYFLHFTLHDMLSVLEHYTRLVQLFLYKMICGVYYVVLMQTWQVNFMEWISACSLKCFWLMMCDDDYVDVYLKLLIIYSYFCFILFQNILDFVWTWFLFFEYVGVWFTIIS